MLGLHERIVRKLQATKGHWIVIAQLADVPYSSLAKIAQGHRMAPRIDTLEKLARGIEQLRQLQRDQQIAKHEVLKKAVREREASRRSADPEETAA